MSVVDSCLEHRGKTLHLLKEKSKSSAQPKKRVKLTPYGGEFMNADMIRHAEIRMQNPLYGASTTNLIGNVEDRKSQLGSFASHSQGEPGVDTTMYKEIEPKRTAAQAAKMASRRVPSKERVKE